MRQLYLIRHAKSSWSDPTLADFDRPLNKRGKRDAPVMGQRLKRKSICPDLIVSSSAKRARKTARIIAREIGYSKDEILLNDDIYFSNLLQLFDFIKKTENSVKSLAVVGHNHVITEFAEWLTGSTLVNIPTRGIVLIEFTVKQWYDIEKQTGRLVFFDYPKKSKQNVKAEF